MSQQEATTVEQQEYPLPKLQQRSCPVNITPVAVEEVKHILTKKNIPAGYYLRLGVRSASGCGGTSYLVGFDKPKAGDDAYESHGLVVLMEKRHTMYLVGLELDFVNNDAERGFLLGPPAKAA